MKPTLERIEEGLRHVLEVQKPSLWRDVRRPGTHRDTVIFEIRKKLGRRGADALISYEVEEEGVTIYPNSNYRGDSVCRGTQGYECCLSVLRIRFDDNDQVI